VRVFVTGATGFIGGAIAAALARRPGHEVLALSRSDAGDARLAALGATPVRGDLTRLEPGDVPACDAAIHCAAWVEPWGRRDDYWRANVEGTERTLAAARAAGARRFLHMSTEAVLWRGQPLREVDESHPYPERTPYLYAETKAEAERRVRAANAPDFETLVLRPRFVWGPGDTTLVPEIREMARRGAFVWLDGGRARTSTTHIENLVHGALLALERGRGGGVWFVTDGETTDFRSFLTRLMAAHGVALPDRSLPAFVARPAAALVEGAWRVLGLRGRPPLVRHAVDLMCCDCTLDDTRARRELGYAPVTSVEAGLRQLEASVGG
jgi:nucleoside-diphosphate-sugar epimerase